MSVYKKTNGSFIKDITQIASRIYRDMKSFNGKKKKKTNNQIVISILH